MISTSSVSRVDSSSDSEVSSSAILSDALSSEDVDGLSSSSGKDSLSWMLLSICAAVVSCSELVSTSDGLSEIVVCTSSEATVSSEILSETVACVSICEAAVSSNKLTLSWLLSTETVVCGSCSDNIAISAAFFSCSACVCNAVSSAYTTFDANITDANKNDVTFFNNALFFLIRYSLFLLYT